MSVVRAAAAVDPDAARREAGRILSDRRYRSSSAPRPLRGLVRWVGDRVDSLLSSLGRLLQAVSAWIWIVAAVVVVAVIVWTIVRGRRRRAASTPAVKAGRVRPDESEDADALEREADAAEREGDLGGAVRLRFRAGLLRLGDRGAIHYRPSVTTGEVRRALESPRFDDLAETFEAVTYGGTPADRPAVDAARREWPNVLEDSGRR